MIQSLSSYKWDEQTGGALSSSPTKHSMKTACHIWMENQCLQCGGAQAQALKPQMFCPYPGLPFSFHCIFTFEVSNETLDWQNWTLQHFRGWVFVVTIIYSVVCSFHCHLLHMEWYNHSMPTSHFKRKNQKSVSRLQSGKKRVPNTFCMSLLWPQDITKS